MHITIIGAGPAGLYFALLMKKADPSRAITVFERDGPDDTFGWGIVFSDQTFSYLQEADEPSYHAIVSSCATWDNVDVVHQGRLVTIRGNRFSGIARIGFLKILQRRCAALGVDLRFRTPMTDLDGLRASDLLVGADGASSRVRDSFRDAFQPTIAAAQNKYIWLGTHRLFHGLTLTFREVDTGVFTAHSYKFNDTTSTFIVECRPETWAQEGFAAMSEAETRARLEEIFREDLHGEPLLTNNFVRWLNFTLVKNRHWTAGRTVLLGDALHTAHFSIGSGTKLALEDAIALAGSFDRARSVEEALAEFERVRKPIVEQYQAVAMDSLHWFENVHDDIRLDPLEFAYRLMTRSGRIDHEKLKRRDPAFVEAYERAVRSAEPSP